jgi:Protein of unknown function (DUF2752)
VVADGSRQTKHDRLTPTLIGGLAAAGFGLIAVRNPNVAGSYGRCPFKALTGWDCPFCGGLRGTYALLHGNIGEALDHNVLLPAFLGGLALLLWATWARWDFGSWSRTTRGRRVIVGAVILLVGFWVARNLPGMTYLNSALTS